MIDYINGTLSLTGSEEFYNASVEELRVLLVLLEQNHTPDVEELAARARVSVARAGAALSYWECAGVVGGIDRPLRYEFESHTHREDEEAPLTEVASTVRDAALAALLHDCAALLGKPTLTDTEIKRIVELYDRHGIPEDYLLTLLADMAKGEKRVSITYFSKKALRLFEEEGITTADALAVYFSSRDERLEGERIYRALIGEWRRALTDTEKERLLRWCGEYGYGEQVLRLAYNLAIDAGAKRIPQYMDKLLREWNEKGLRTPTACRTHYESTAPTYDKKTAAPQKKPASRQGNFDPDEVFRLALERSYGDGNKENT